jgi:lysophospholipase L1-like esterase
MQRPDTPDGLFIDGNPATGVKGTPITAEWLNALIAVGAFLSGDAEPPDAGLGGPGDYYVCKVAPFNLYGPKDQDTGWPGAATRLHGDTINIGEVTTGEPGSLATITNVGTARDIVLDISIPQGDIGLTGNPYKAYATKALATADLANIPADALIWVNADSTPANNGFYAKTGGVLAQSSYDRVALVEASAASNKAVAETARKDAGLSVIPENSRFDSNTPVTSTTAGIFGFSLGSGTLATHDEGVQNTPNAGSNNIVSNNTLLTNMAGKTWFYKFEAKGLSASGALHFALGNTISTANSIQLALTTAWKTFEGSLVAGSANLNRIAFIQLSTALLPYAIRNFSLVEGKELLLDRLAGIEGDIAENSGAISNTNQVASDFRDELSTIIPLEIIPSDSRMDANTPVTSTTAGEFIAFRNAVFSAGSEGGVTVQITAGLSYSGLRHETLLSPYVNGREFTLSGEIKRISGSGDLGVYPETDSSQATITPTDAWTSFSVTIYPAGKAGYDDGRFTIGAKSSDTTITFEIRKLSIKAISYLDQTLLSQDSRIETLEALSGLTPLKVSIIGDSISTCQTNNAVELTILAGDVGNTISAYPTINDFNAGLTIGGVAVTLGMVGVLTAFTPAAGDIGKVIGKPANYNTLTQDQLWWGKMAADLGLTVLQNVSWSGASISSHEGTDDTYKTSYAWHPAQVRKCATRDAAGAWINPDVIIIYRGTNDFSHSPYAKLTTFDNTLTAIPADDVVTGGFGFKEALALTVSNLRAAYPFARIVLCTLNIFKRVIYDHFPTRNGTNTLPEFNDAIRKVADIMGCGLIEFDKSGVTFENIYPTYASDSATTPTHPNAVGHAKMAERAKKDIVSVIN